MSMQLILWGYQTNSHSSQKVTFFGKYCILVLNGGWAVPGTTDSLKTRTTG